MDDNKGFEFIHQNEENILDDDYDEKEDHHDDNMRK